MWNEEHFDVLVNEAERRGRALQTKKLNQSVSSVSHRDKAFATLMLQILSTSCCSFLHVQLFALNNVCVFFLLFFFHIQLFNQLLIQMIVSEMIAK